MSEILSFPGLGWEIPINRVAFTFFGRPIYWYGIMFAVAFLLAAIYVLRRHRLFGVDEDRMIDVLLGAVVGGVVGARIYYVAFTWDTYRDDPARIIRVWEGGIALYGALIGAVIAIVLLCRWRKVRLLPLLDLFVGGLVLGQAIGRWGNFFNMEAFGSNTTLPWGMTSNTIASYLSYHRESLAAVGMQVDPSMPVHPTFLYESIWCLLGFFLLFWYTKRRRYDGEMTLIYFGWYGLGRFFIEGLRTDSLMIGSLRVSQLVAALCVVASLVVMVLMRRRIAALDPADRPRLYVDTEEGQAVLAGTFYPKKDKKSDDRDRDSSDEENADKDVEASDAAENPGPEPDSEADEHGNADEEPDSEPEPQGVEDDGESASTPGEADGQSDDAPADADEDSVTPHHSGEPDVSGPDDAEDSDDESEKKPQDS